MFIQIVFLYYIISISRNKMDEDQEKRQYGIIKSLLFVVLGLSGIIFGSNLVVNSATIIAKNLGISERIISSSFQIQDIITLLLTSILLYLIPKTNHYKITRKAGVLLVTLILSIIL